MKWRFSYLRRLNVLLLVGILTLTLFLAEFGYASAEESIPYSCTETTVDLDPGGHGDDDGIENKDELSGQQVGKSGNPVKTDPCNADSDGDGLTDSEEFLGAGPVQKIGLISDELRRVIDSWGIVEDRKPYTNPLKSDHDGDGVSDGEEFEPYTILLNGGFAGNQITAISNPIVVDTDDDLLNDKIERDGWSITVNGETRSFKSSPLEADTDGDGLTDKQEYDPVDSRWGTFRTDPTMKDTDGDGLEDLDERNRGLDPSRKDTDGDGLEDGTEVESVWCDADRADTDGDGRADGLSENLQCGTYDRDMDGIPDVLEEKLNLNADESDTDSDGLSDLEEIQHSTHPSRKDTDGDGIPDNKDDNPNFTGTSSELEGLTEKLEEANELVVQNNKEIARLSGINDRLEQNQDTGNIRTDELSLNRGSDASPASSSNTSNNWIFVTIAGVVALIIGVSVGYFVLNRAPKPDDILRDEVRKEILSDERQVRTLEDNIKAQPEFIQRADQQADDRLQHAIQTDIASKRAEALIDLESSRSELRSVANAASRGIPEALLQDAEDLITRSGEGSIVQNANIKAASELINGVNRHYLRHRT